MAGGHIGLEQEEIVACGAVTEAGRPFGRFPVLNLRVVEPSEDQQGRIIHVRDIIVGGVGEHIVVSLLFGGVSPLIVFECGERNCVIEHGGYHVNERNMGNSAKTMNLANRTDN